MAEIKGTSSTAVQNKDGTWDILRVPIVCEGSIPRFSKENQVVDEWKVTPDWMTACIHTHRIRESEGYPGRGFIDHHGKEGSQPDAGFIRPTHLTTIRVRGKTLKALAADLINVPDHIYQTYIKTGRMPYRSIESLRAETNFIDGLALMPTRSPHFQLPILTIGEEIPRSDSVSFDTPPEALSEPLAVACADSQHATAAIRRYSQMPKTKAQIRAEESGGESEYEEDEAESESTTCSWQELMQDLEECELPASEIPEFVSALQSLAERLSEAVEDDEEEDAEEDDGDEIDEGTPIAEQPETQGTMAQASGYAKLAAENAHLSARLARIEKKEKREAAISAAMAEVGNRDIGENPEAVLRAQWKAGGQAALNGFVAAAKSLPASPGENPEWVTDSAFSGEPMPAVLEQYTDAHDLHAAQEAYASIQAQRAADWEITPQQEKNRIKRAVERAREERK